MIEAYKVGVSLVLDQSKILGPLGEVMSSLEKVLDIQKNVQGSINQMAAGYRAAASAAKEMASAVERMAKAQNTMQRPGQAGGGYGGVGNAAPLATGGGPSIRGPSMPLMLPAPDVRGGTFSGGPGSGGTLVPMGGAGASFSPIELGALPRDRAQPLVWSRGERPGTADMMMLGMGAGAASYGAFDFLDHLWDAGIDVGKIKAGLLTQRFTPEQVAAAEAAAKATQRTVTGSAVGGNLELVSMLMAMTQSAPDAIELMPDYAKTAVALAASGHGEQVSEMQAAMRGAELRGILYRKDKTGEEVLDKAALGNYLHQMLAFNAMSHGTIGPAQVTSFLKSGGVAGMMLSDDDLAASIPLIQAMGASNAGTALSGFSQQFSAGKMSEAAMNMLADMGIIKDKSKARKMGMGQFMLLPGAMRLEDVNDARFHPSHFIMDTMLPRIREYEKKFYGKGFTGADDKTQMAMVAAAFQQVASRIPGGKEMAEVVRNNPLILRDVAAYKKEMGVDIFGTQVANNPAVTQSAFRASVSGLMISLSEPNMKTGTNALSDLTRGLNALSAVFDKHPNFARYAVDAAAGIGVVMAAIAAMVPALLVAGAAIKTAKWAIPVPAAAKGAGFWSGLGASAEAGATGAARIGSRFLGALGFGTLAWQAGESVGTSPAWQAFGDHIQKAADAAVARANLHATINVNVDGKKVQTTRAVTPIQSGTTGHDGSMSPYPAGPAAGDGK